MDQALSLDQHVKICSCFFFQLGNIAKLRPTVSQPEMDMLIHAVTLFCLDYCDSIFTGLIKESLYRLQVLQNAAAKLLTRSSKGFCDADLDFSSLAPHQSQNSIQGSCDHI